MELGDTNASCQTEASSESELLFIKTKGQFWRGWCSSQCIAELLNHLFYSICATPSFVPSSVLPVVEPPLLGGAGQSPVPDFIWE